MAGTVTITEKTYASVKAIKFAWTSSAGGAADATTTGIYTGEVLRTVQIPGTGGVQPTDLYDVVVNDDDGADILLGTGANLGNAVTTQKAPADKLGTGCVSKLTLQVTNAGASKSGTTIVYLR